MTGRESLHAIVREALALSIAVSHYANTHPKLAVTFEAPGKRFNETT